MKSGNNRNKYKYNIKKLFHCIKTTFKKQKLFHCIKITLQVYIGKTKKDEVDFVATKNKDLKYIQVSYSLSEEDYSRDGIKYINIFDFLMNDDF